MDPPAVAATATTAPPSPADEQEARRRALLLEARRARLAWVRDDDYEELEDPTEALLRSLEHDHDEDDADHKGDDDDGTAALPSGWRRGRVSELLAHAAAAAAAGPDGETGAGALLLPSAREYVAFLNRLVGEGDAEAVHYPAAALRARLPGDAALLRGGEGEGEGDGAVGMPPLPALPTRDGDELTYEAFVARLAHPLSAEVVGALQRYVAGFVRRQRRRAREQGAAAEEPLDAEAMEGGIDAVAEGLHAFIDGLRAEMRKSPAWRALVSEPDPLLLLPRQQPQPPPPPPPAGAGGGWEGVRDHLEAFLMMKLRRYLFTPRERAALAARDAALAGRLRALAFLGPEHLDVRSVSVFGVGVYGLVVVFFFIALRQTPLTYHCPFFIPPTRHSSSPPPPTPPPPHLQQLPRPSPRPSRPQSPR